ncbi:MAG: 5-formyltetrahydrofolate cyclo-ligase [Rickettsiales bacterium]|jgi:5-formyltetrahydrofolate cyclo-ligase
MTKSTIRIIYKQKRLNLSKEQVLQDSSDIAKNFINNLLPKIVDFKNKKLAFYVSTNNEVNPIQIIKHCKKLGNQISLPKINQNLELNFKSYVLGDELVVNKNYPKLLEPSESKTNITPDIVFVPLVAFDENCHRIGMGGGFYDAMISRSRTGNLKQIFIGLGYEMQKCDRIELDKWDQNLDLIISQINITLCKQ